MELFTPDFGLVFWMFVAFGVLFLVLWRFAWPIILKTVDSRADLIDKGVEYAQEAKEQLDNARQQADSFLNEARRQQADMLREADRMKTQIIEQARKEAQQQFRNQVSNFAFDIAGKIIGQQMSADKAQEQFVDKMLDQLENKN